MLTKTVGTVQLTPATLLTSEAVTQEFKASFDKAAETNIETGGWIFYNSANGTFKTKRQTKGAQEDSIILTPVPAAETGYVVVADWHCHPGNNVAGSRPSGADINIAKSKQYFMLVLTFKKAPKSGWKADLLTQVQIVDDNASYRLWNII